MGRPGPRGSLGSPGGWRREDWRPTTCPPRTLGLAHQQPCWSSSCGSGGWRPLPGHAGSQEGWAGSHSAPWRSDCSAPENRACLGALPPSPPQFAHLTAACAGTLFLWPRHHHPTLSRTKCKKRAPGLTWSAAASHGCSSMARFS